MVAATEHAKRDYRKASPDALPAYSLLIEKLMRGVPASSMARHMARRVYSGRVFVHRQGRYRMLFTTDMPGPADVGTTYTILGFTDRADSRVYSHES